VGFQMTTGGLANTNIRLELAKHATPILLRLFVRDAAQAQKECRLLELLQDTVPVPRVLYFSPQNHISGHPLLLLDWVEGQIFEDRLEGCSIKDIGAIANSIGESLAAIHSYKFESCGFFGEDLSIATPITICGAGLLEYANECLITKGGISILGPQITKDVLFFLEQEGSLVDEWQIEPCLTHSDFSPSNILLDGADSNSHVAAVLDWEFAFSGSPLFDFGNLLRDPVSKLPGFTQALTEGYCHSGGRLHPEWKRMSLLVDLTAWFEFTTRKDIGSDLAEDAHCVIRATIEQFGQVHP